LEYNKAKIFGLLENEDLTYGQLKEQIGVTNKMLAEYLRDLESECKIEFYQKEDKRIKYYRINPSKRQEAKLQVDKQLLKSLLIR